MIFEKIGSDRNRPALKRNEMRRAAPTIFERCEARRGDDRFRRAQSRAVTNFKNVTATIGNAASGGEQNRAVFWSSTAVSCKEQNSTQ